MRSIWILIALAVVAAPAFADESLPTVITPPPPPPPKPAGSLTLPQHKWSVTLTLEVESSTDRLAKPVAVAPDVAYGATDHLMLSVVHSKFAVTGFRAVTGGGVCLGSDTACAHVYNNVGAEAVYALRDGPLAIAAVGGVHAMDLAAGFYDAKLGGRLRYSRGRAGVTALPSVLIAMTERLEMGTRRNKDLYYLPLLATYKVVPPLTLGLGSGVKGSLNDLGKTWELPLGVVATYAVNRQISLGASFVFGKLVGGADDPPSPAPAATGPDFRGTEVWVAMVP
jgi:hypothetical protein